MSNYLFLEVLPRLNPGRQLCMSATSSLPFDYPRDWVMNEFRFWSEQYLLQAFLTFNSEFRSPDGQLLPGTQIPAIRN